MTGPVAPLWTPFALAAAEVAWTFGWYFVLRALLDFGLMDYSAGQRIDPPAWKSALSYAIGVPAAILAGLGFLGIGALFVAATGSIVASW